MGVRLPAGCRELKDITLQSICPLTHRVSTAGDNSC